MRKRVHPNSSLLLQLSSKSYRKERLTQTFIVGHNNAPNTNNTKTNFKFISTIYILFNFFSNINNNNCPFSSQNLLHKSFLITLSLFISILNPLSFNPKINYTSIDDNCSTKGTNYGRFLCFEVREDYQIQCLLLMPFVLIATLEEF